MSLYKDLKRRGLEVEGHETDLYVEDTPEARNVLHQHSVTDIYPFTDAEGRKWIEVPFAFDPGWEALTTF